MISRRAWTSFALLAFPAPAQLQKAKVIILIGPPGSGKSVQADFLKKRYKIPPISMSQLLRKAIASKSSIGVSLAASLHSGELFGDSSSNELVKARLMLPDTAKGFILDGYPSTEGQARALDDFLIENKFTKPSIVFLDVPEEVLRQRMAKRSRADDTPDNIERKLVDFRDAGKLLQKWYGNDRMIKVDGTGTPPEVAARVAQAIETLQERNAEFATRPEN